LKLVYNNLDGDEYEEFSKKSEIENDNNPPTRENIHPTYENKLAHRLSIVLNRIGQAAFAGDLPLDHIFPISSKMILKDWQTSKALIKKISGSDYSAIAYTKKYFRWLACASCMYIITYHASEWKQADEYIKQYVMNGVNFEQYIFNNGKKMINEIIVNETIITTFLLYL